MKTVKELKFGKTTLRLVETGKTFAGVVLRDDQIKLRLDGDDPDKIWSDLRNEAGSTSPDYIGYDGAINRFKSFFTDGFASKTYIEQERAYKLAAKALLDKTVPLHEAINGNGHGEKIRSVFTKTNLLSPYENMRVTDALRGPDADRFIKGAAIFAMGDIAHGLEEMEIALRPHEAAKWTIVTYLPFLWKPSDHMYLKPTVTQDFAERIGHPFAHDYNSQLDLSVYESLLDMAKETEQKIKPMAPTDRIDIQSFIWVVGEYIDAS